MTIIRGLRLLDIRTRVFLPYASNPAFDSG